MCILKKVPFLVFSLAVSYLSADDAPCDIQVVSPPLIDNLKGIVLFENQEAEQKFLHTEGIDWGGLAIPGRPEDLRKLLSVFLEKPVTLETLGEIKKTISDYYLRNSRPFVILKVPEQEITSGILQLSLLESKLGQLTVEGNQWTSSERIKKYFQIKPGEPINENRLIQNISFINRNPFRRSDLIFMPGAQEGTTDVTIFTKDRRPFRVYAGSNNLAVQVLGSNQWYAGFNWGQAFGFDHILSYQFISTFNMHVFQAHTAEYTALLSWGHVFNIYGGYSEVHPPVPSSLKRNDGWSMQASARYVIPLTIYPYLEHEITAGGDFKRTNNTFEFTEQFPVFAQNVNLTQIVLGYSGNYERNNYRLDFNGSFYWSPGRWLSDQTNAAYSSLRPGAQNKWLYFYGYFTYLQRLPKSFSLSLRGSGQGSTEPLLPSEQFSLGGFETVRGYEENEANVDNAIVLNAEARSPAMPIAKWINPKFKVPDGLQFLVFFDYGWGINIVNIPGTQKAVYLMGAGPGVRYTLEPYLTARLDWGIRLHDKPWFNGNWSRLHFNVTASY